MKKGKHKFRHARQLKGQFTSGYAELEIRGSEEAKLTDACEWKELKESYSNFVMLDVFNEWKKGGIAAANYILSTYKLTEKAEVIIHDVAGRYIDTSPVSISAVVFIGIFDICKDPLSKEDLRNLNEFVFLNDKKKVLDFSNLELSKTKIEI